MSKVKGSRFSRRDFLKFAAVSAAAGPFFAFPSRALASQRTLRIGKWAHFVPEFDIWFEGMAKEWGRQHDIHVTVDRIPAEQIHQRAAEEVKQGKGHDVMMFPWPPAEFCQHVIDHNEIYQALRLKVGVIDKLAHRSTYYVKQRKYFAFCDSWMPAPLHYFTDYWAEAGMPMGPLYYGSLRSGGKRIREKLGVSCGLAMTPTLEGNITMHTVLVAFGGAVLNVQGRVMLDGARTTEALKYVKLLYQETGTPDQLSWGPSDNVKAMLARKTTCSVNAISLLRAAEHQDPEVAKKIMIQPPLLGSAGSGIVATPHITNCSAVWKFGRNQEAAKQFLIDLVDTGKTGYEQSKGCNLPIYQKALPDLIVRLENDRTSDPPDKNKQLKDALHWTHNLGVPGYATPAFMETFNKFVIPSMFLSVVKGEKSPEDASREAAAVVQRIAEKWKDV
ncbi:MAG TPA: ABC transporter substrate-binding protein [Thermoanaerobaculia bacterium]|nr:ABC transporter substrate-binding protein [Thermoanaerobaculia bacterium]